MRRRVVVFPQPDGPSSEKNSPPTTSRLMPSTAVTSAKRLTRSTIWTWPPVMNQDLKRFANTSELSNGEPATNAESQPTRRGRSRAYQRGLVANVAHTTLPRAVGEVQPHSSHSDSTTCSPRPLSSDQQGSRGAGTSSLGSEIAHSTHGPGCSRPSRTGQRGHATPGQGTVYRKALVSNSDTTITMSSLRSATPQRCKVAAVKSLATRTDSAPAPGVRVATRGYPRLRRASGGRTIGQIPLTSAAISAADMSQRQLPAAPPRADEHALSSSVGAVVMAASDTTDPPLSPDSGLQTCASRILPHARSLCKHQMHVHQHVTLSRADLQQGRTNLSAPCCPHERTTRRTHAVR